LNDRLPTELRQFIALHIESLAQLEALLLLRRERGRAMKLGELARTLYISDDMCRGMLVDLARRGFIEGELDGESFRYATMEESTEGMISQLAEFYQNRRVAVITEIYSNPSKKVQTFADAFRLRKGDTP
jgi:predicted DNA-binding transcriptional regulator